MEQLKIRPAAVSIVLATLAACGGGGGGGGGGPIAVGTPPPSEVTFTSFAAILPNQTVVTDGIAVTASGNQTISNGDYTITSAAPLGAAGSATVRLSYDAAATPALRQIDLSTPSSPNVSVNRDTPGQGITCSGHTCFINNGATTGLVFDAVAAGWNYQSLGVWTTDVTPTSWVAGAVSLGSATSGNSLPTTGTAVFNGLALGAYINSAGTPFVTTASMRANVDFGSGNIQFSTSNTILANANTGASSADNGLNLSGMLSYAQGVNSFSGGLTTANGSMNGQGTGRFYGPSAQEVGGVYSLSGGGVNRMIGAFGGKR